MAKIYEVATGAEKLGEFPGLTVSARLIVLYMICYKHEYKEWPSIKKIEENTGVGARTFDRAWKILRSEGIIRQVV